MKKLALVLFAPLALTACKTTGDLVNCENAQKARAAAIAVVTAVDRYCPASF